MGAVVSCIKGILRTIGNCLSAIVNGIAGILQAIIRGIANVFNILISCLTCGHYGSTRSRMGHHTRHTRTSRI
jgi:phage-related protein